MNRQKTAAELEHEVESHRAHLASTLDQISGRMTPGQVLDEAWEFARESGGGEFARNLGTSVRDNPLPVGLITAGIAWLMSGRSGRLPRVSRGSGRPSDRAALNGRLDTSYDGYAGSDRLANGNASQSGEGPGFIEKAAGSVTSAAASARSRLGQAAETASDTAQIAAEDALETAEQIRRSASESMRQFRDTAGERGRQVRARAETFADEQPVLLAVAGLAIGALVGVMARSTAAESRLMGEASDRIKDRARDAAATGLNGAVDVAERTYGAVREEAEKEGLTPEAAREAADELTRKVRKVAKRGQEQLEEELDAASETAAHPS